MISYCLLLSEYLLHSTKEKGKLSINNLTIEYHDM